MRRSNWWKRAACAAGLALTLFTAAPADATVVVHVDRPQLVDMSDLVVRATVGNLASRWNEGHTQILTLTRLSVTQYLKGAGPAELVLRQFGGEVDGLVSRISGEAYLQPGQDVVLCLRRGDGVVYLTAMAQSVWFVSAQPAAALPTVQRDLSGLTFARVANGRVQVDESTRADAPETLQHLLVDLAALSRRATVPMTLVAPPAVTAR